MTMTDIAPAVIPVPASVWVACSTTDCPAFGIQRQVWFQLAAVGVVSMPTLLCQRCSCRMPTPAFPWEDAMPKLHADRPPTYAVDIAAPAETKAEPPELEPVAAEEPAGEPAEAAETAPKKTTTRRKTK